MNVAARVVVAIALPALAIVVAAGAQEVLTRWLPGVTGLAFAHSTVGSYLGLALELGAGAIAGSWLSRHLKARAEGLASGVAPLAWAVALLLGVLGQGGPIDWHKQAVWFVVAIAVCPACGLIAGWLIAGNRRPEEA